MEGTRIAILTCFGLSLLGVGTDFWLRDKQKQAEKDETRGLALLTDITSAKLDVDILDQEKMNDSYLREKSNNRLGEFFELTAKQKAKMEKGPGVSPQKEQASSKQGYADTSYELTWGRGSRAGERYGRDQIAVFMWHVEQASSLLKITYIKLSTDPSKRDDLWEPVITVTERRPNSQEAAATGG